MSRRQFHRVVILGLLGALGLMSSARSETGLAANGQTAGTALWQLAAAKAPAKPTPAAAAPGIEIQPEEIERRRANAWTVGLVSGLLQGTYIRFAAELSVVLNKDEDLRVIPMVTPGAIQNIKDLIYLRGVDVAITQSDVLEYVKKTEKIPNLENRMVYITRLYYSEVQIFARQEFHTLQDLAGKRVNLHQPGTAPTLTGKILFDRLGIPIQASYLNNAIAIEKMKTGEIDALVQVTSKPNDLFTKFNGEGFHFIPIPEFDKFSDLYLPTTLTATDYPKLIGANEKVDTLAVSTLLAAYDWPENHDRYQRVARFIERLFEKLPELQDGAAFHPKWRDVNLAGTIPGWRQHRVAERLLRERKKQQTAAAAPAVAPATQTQFNEFLQQRGSVQIGNLPPEMRDALFQAFLEYVATHPQDGVTR